jgi:hypothetical protein
MDLVSGGLYSTVKNTTNEMQKLEQTLTELLGEFEKLANKIAALPQAVANKLTAIGRQLEKAGKESLTAVVAKGESTVSKAKGGVAQDAQQAKVLVNTFRRQGVGACGTGASKNYSTTMSQLLAADAKLRELERDARQLPLKAVSDANNFVQNGLQSEVEQQVRLTTQTVQNSVTIASKSMLDSLTVATKTLENFVKEPIATLTNPVGELKKQADAALGLVEGKLDSVDSSLTQHASALKETLVAKIHKHRDDVLALEEHAGARAQFALSQQLLSRMRGAAKNCSAAETSSLVQATSKPNPTLPSKPSSVPASYDAARGVRIETDMLGNSVLPKRVSSALSSKLVAATNAFETVKRRSEQSLPNAEKRRKLEADLSAACESKADRNAVEGALRTRLAGSATLRSSALARLAVLCREPRSTTPRPLRPAPSRIRNGAAIR